MIELKIVSGPESGRRVLVGSLPIRIGRSRDMDVVLSGPGVWDHHFDLEVTPQGRVGMRSFGGASVLIDGQAVTEAPLRNGTLLDLAGVRVRFALAPGEQRSLAWRERVFWMAAVALVGVQVGLLIWTGLRS